MLCSKDRQSPLTRKTSEAVKGPVGMVQFRVSREPELVTAQDEKVNLILEIDGARAAGADLFSRACPCVCCLPVALAVVIGKVMGFRSSRKIRPPMTLTPASWFLTPDPQKSLTVYVPGSRKQASANWHDDFRAILNGARRKPGSCSQAKLVVEAAWLCAHVGNPPVVCLTFRRVAALRAR